MQTIVGFSELNHANTTESCYVRLSFLSEVSSTDAAGTKYFLNNLPVLPLSYDQVLVIIYCVIQYEVYRCH